MTILLTAGGTATSWYLSNVWKKYFNDHRLVVTDINDPDFVASSALASAFYKVPAVGAVDYIDVMKSIIAKEKVDFIIPLIDTDLLKFPSDFFKSSSVSSANLISFENKMSIHSLLIANGIPVPFLINDLDEVDLGARYCIKPINGFGSKGVIFKLGSEVNISDFSNSIVQKECFGPELTVDVFHVNKRYKYVCRERVETKAGVSTKAKFIESVEVGNIVDALINRIELPNAFCFQVMRNSNSRWVVTDLNIRLGAGSSISAKAGFDIGRACFELWTSSGSDPFDHLKDVQSGSVVVRVYEDVLMR